MKYEEARNEANRLVRKAKYEYERAIAINNKKDSKIFWKFIQSKTEDNRFIYLYVKISDDRHHKTNG
jgi:hypothetical protein